MKGSSFSSKLIQFPTNRNSFPRLKQELDHEATVYREQLNEKELENQFLRQELLRQELQLRNELTDDFESYCVQREATFQTRLKQAQEAAALPYKSQV